jgi:hydroxymethylpyrimidine pyrophosphatase-like HAD family hydrolase
MPLDESQHLQLQDFFNQSDFTGCGGVVTDLDGTAIHEYQGRYSIPDTVELGLKRIYDLGRPVVINTLRFPLSVMRTFGRDWYRISNNPIPTVLMNGSQLGYIVQNNKDELEYQEIAAFPLREEDIDHVIAKVNHLVADGILDLLVFFYPRKWELGEVIWTPVKEKIPSVHNKYLSASSVISGEIAELEATLKSQELCMIFLLVDIPEDKLMAYQHTKKSNFFNREGVDKRSGAVAISSHLDFDLQHSVGAGDSEMDAFLTAVGLAVHVGNPYLGLKGVSPPLKLRGSSELGELLFELANMQRTVIK